MSEAKLKSKRMRASGTLGRNARGFSILTESGDLWVLDIDTIEPELTGKLITVEGIAIGLDRLHVEWIGQASR